MQVKSGVPDVPAAGLAVLRQQYILAQAMEEWIASVGPFDGKKRINRRPEGCKYVLAALRPSVYIN